MYTSDGYKIKKYISKLYNHKIDRDIFMQKLSAYCGRDDICPEQYGGVCHVIETSKKTVQKNMIGGSEISEKIHNVKEKFLEEYVQMLIYNNLIYDLNTKTIEDILKKKSENENEIDEKSKTGDKYVLEFKPDKWDNPVKYITNVGLYLSSKYNNNKDPKNSDIYIYIDDGVSEKDIYSAIKNAKKPIDDANKSQEKKPEQSNPPENNPTTINPENNPPKAEQDINKILDEKLDAMINSIYVIYIKENNT